MPKAGDIALFKGKEDLLSETIEFFTQPPYTHSGFFIDSNTIVEMWWTGIRYRNMTDETGYDVFTPKVPLTQEQINKGIEYAKHKVKEKTRYNFLALVGILIEKVFHVKKNIFYSQYSEICSELVSEIFIVMGEDVCPEIEDASTTPADEGNSKVLVKTESH